ncbi:uncharacterized protein IUM83_15328 [Phytophthora cinnamomi]|uniref:uncharacterized protein n=1 Tax=Phytophthora cinnamomi TaxID=4785 RepID=UPI00355A542A|nr:hypothetical protein IUM83_15328 [Phytophthora cinnamomi]
MVCKALSGYDLEAEVKVPDLKPFEAETQKKIVSVQHSLFVTCYKMESAKYNLSLQAVDVLAAYIVLHYSMMKGSALMHRPSGAWNQLNRNQAPAAGWSYITAEGAAMVSILRCYEWFVEAMDELRTRELEQQMSGVEIEDEGTETNAEDDETKEN